MGESTKLGLLLCASSARSILVCVCGCHQSWLERSKISIAWTKLMKHVDLGKLTFFLDHVYLGCTHRECKPNESMVDEDRHKFDLRQQLSMHIQRFHDGRDLFVRWQLTSRDRNRLHSARNVVHGVLVHHSIQVSEWTQWSQQPVSLTKVSSVVLRLHCLECVCSRFDNLL